MGLAEISFNALPLFVKNWACPELPSENRPRDQRNARPALSIAATAPPDMHYVRDQVAQFAFSPGLARGCCLSC